MHKLIWILSLSFFVSAVAFEGMTWKQMEALYPLITPEDWELAEPYLIPLDHEAIGILDTLFSDPLVLSNVQTLEVSGFKIIRYRRSKKLVVASHPKLKKYLIKAYLEDYNHYEVRNWASRARGSHFIQTILDENDLNHLFRVPRKWIYPLPRTKKTNFYHKNFILLVDKMDLLTEEQCKHKFKTQVSESFLLKLYEMIVLTGYSDCHLGNLPFCKDGKIALIDLEYYNLEPVHMHKLSSHLSLKHQKLWKKLCSQKPKTAPP